MFSRIPKLALWIFLAAAVVTLPLACSSSSSGTDANHDTASSDATGL